MPVIKQLKLELSWQLPGSTVQFATQAVLSDFKNLPLEQDKQ